MGVFLPNASVSAALVLCSCAFFFGRFSVHDSQLPDIRAPEIEPLEVTRHATRSVRAVEGGGDAKLHAAVKAPSSTLLSHMNPLDPKYEQDMLKASGMLQLRPPLPAAASGDNFLHVIPFQILSWYPRVVVYPGFIDKERCDHIIAIANATMFPSAVAFRPGEKYDQEQQTRTSKGAYLMSQSDPAGVLGWLEERIAAAAMIRADYGEAFNVLHYEHMQHYDSHYDTFDPKEYGPQRSQRIVTVLTYLSVAEEGGETVFKREGREGEERSVTDWRNCDDGSYKYMPRQGDALMFWAVKPNGDIDHHALHGGCPVKRGEKWVATKWIRSRSTSGKDD